MGNLRLPRHRQPVRRVQHCRGEPRLQGYGASIAAVAFGGFAAALIAYAFAPEQVQVGRDSIVSRNGPPEVVSTMSMFKEQEAMNDTVRRRRSEALSIRPLSGHIGAEVQGIQLGSQMAPNDIRFITQALLTHRVIFFRRQHHLDDRAQELFAQAFGEIVKHPTMGGKTGSAILELHSHEGGRANSWHTDVTFGLRPPKLSVLRALALPDAGGDTVWANTVAAYQHLPSSLQDLVDKLWAVHGNDFDYAASRVELLHDPVAKEYRKKYAAQVIKTEHPVVQIHPETGEKSLLLGHYAQRFVQYDTHDSNRLYEILQAHITRLENTVRWHWAAGDVAIWDNRSTQHYAINDYGDATRVMRRVTVIGDIPVAVDGRKSVPHEA
nr:TauD/TfdA family dioxygenase [Burkholderia pseudomallei]